MSQNLQEQNLSPEEKAAFDLYTCFFPALSMTCPLCNKRHPFPTRDIRRSQPALLSAITGEVGTCTCELCKSSFHFRVNASVSTGISPLIKETNMNIAEEIIAAYKNMPNIDEAFDLAVRIEALGNFLILAEDCDRNLNIHAACLGRVIEDLALELEGVLHPVHE